MFSEKGFTKSVVVLAVLLAVAICGIGPLRQSCSELYLQFKEKGDQIALERQKFTNYARAKLSPREIKKLFTPRDEAIENKDELKKQDRIDLDKLIH